MRYWIEGLYRNILRFGFKIDELRVYRDPESETLKITTRLKSYAGGIPKQIQSFIYNEFQSQ